MADGNVRFIRVNGRVIPVREKNYVGTKTKESDAGDRALRGLKKGATVGAGIGVAIGALTGRGALAKVGSAANFGAGTGLTLGLIGAGLTMAFGDRKKVVKTKKKKFSSI